MSPIRIFLLAAAWVVALPAQAQEIPANPQIDYPGFVELAGKVGAYRQERRLPWSEFAAANPDLLARRPSVLATYYSEALLSSDRARRAFVMPDRVEPHCAY